MAKHLLPAAHIVETEAKRLELLAVHAALPALKAAKAAAEDALAAAEANLQRLLNDLASAAFHGLGIDDAPMTMSAKKDEPTPPGAKATAIANAKAAASKKL